MRIIYCNGVFALSPGSDAKVDAAAAKAAGFFWHDPRSPRHDACCRACEAHVPPKTWWTWSEDTAAKLLEAVALDPEQAPETLAVLQPHRPRGVDRYEGDPQPELPLAAPVREACVEPPARSAGPTWLRPEKVRSVAEAALGDDEDDDE